MQNIGKRVSIIIISLESELEQKENEDIKGMQDSEKVVGSIHFRPQGAIELLKFRSYREQGLSRSYPYCQTGLWCQYK